MLDTNDLLVAIKKASMDAVNSAKPVDIVYGRVEAIAPLEINVENKMSLSSDMVLVPGIFKVHRVMVNVDGVLHEGTLDYTLKFGDRVILLSSPGGQKYVVLDKVSL